MGTVEGTHTGSDNMGRFWRETMKDSADVRTSVKVKNPDGSGYAVDLLAVGSAGLTIAEALEAVEAARVAVRTGEREAIADDLSEKMKHVLSSGKEVTIVNRPSTACHVDRLALDIVDAVDGDVDAMQLRIAENQKEDARKAAEHAAKMAAIVKAKEELRDMERAAAVPTKGSGSPAVDARVSAPAPTVEAMKNGKK